jgi:hypothetical protein
VQRRLNGLIEGEVEDGTRVGRGLGRSVGRREQRVSRRIPGHTEAVDIEEAVASSDLSLCCRLSMDGWIVGY